MRIAEAGRILRRDSARVSQYRRAIKTGLETYTIWSRTPRAFNHSPIQISDSSLW